MSRKQKQSEEFIQYTDTEYEQKRQKARETGRKYRRRSTFILRLIMFIISLIILAIVFYLVRTWLSDDPNTFTSDLQNFVEQAAQNGGFPLTQSGQETMPEDGRNGQDVQAVGAEQETQPAIQVLRPDDQNAAANTAGQETPAASADAPGQDTQAAAADAPGQDTQAAAVNTAAQGREGSNPTLEDARLLAAGYDYDGAIAMVKAMPDYASNSDAQEAVSEFEQAKASCVAVDVNTVPHIFYHSLLNDTDRAFNVEVLGQFAVDGMNAWMTTVEEFDAITRQLYDNGYVYVKLRDLVVETVNADGSVSFEANTQLMLPPGKKPIVLSVDDLSYYHSYGPAGFPDKLVLDENGKVKCRYTDAAGNTTVGDYDVVPRLNTFLEQHPDGAYHGARGLIAMTGYNGVFGYRTDIDYELREHLMEDQAVWLENHPDFNRQDEIAQATAIADAIKEEGWEFASHTWGHLSVTGVSVEKLKTDNDKWVANVQNIVGPVDTIIFAHGNDIGSWEGYSAENEQYAYYNSAGYHFYCNVDGSVPYWVQIAPDYVRQGRIDLDGYMLYQASTGQTSVLDNMFNASEVFDQRRPTPVVANGQG